MRRAHEAREPRRGTPRAPRKKRFDVDAVMQKVAAAVAGLPKAALFELADRGYGTPFQQLVACMISVRTFDEVTLPAALRLFEQAPDPAAMAALGTTAIDALIKPSTFHETKAPRIRKIAKLLVDEYDGELPCDLDVLLALPGIGPKCANLVLGIACGVPRVGVDVHVHRVTTRWGYASAPTPEAATAELEAKLPRRYWVEINRVLVPFGKRICTGRAPRCSACPVLAYCRQVGVTERR